MTLIRFALIGFLAFGMAASIGAQTPPKKKRVLFIGQSKGWQHDSVSNAMGTIWKLGNDSGLWETYLRTDCQLVTKKSIRQFNTKNLNYFDAVVFYTSGELDMDDSQKADLLSFVRDDGKGFAAIHSGTDTFYNWPEYGDMVGGYFDGHPWMTFDAPMIVEAPDFPGMKYFPKAFTINDEIYQTKNFSRDKVRVLLRLDDSKLDYTKKGINRTDHDFAVIWARNYGKGRVIYNGLGHPPEVWDKPEIQKMWLDQMKWVLGDIPGDATPRSRK